MPSTAQTANDATPVSASNSALHWAGVAYGLAAAREQQGRFLTTDEQANYTRYQSAARAHGFTEQQVRDYAAALARPTA
jgi:hypothetical protein